MWSWEGPGWTELEDHRCLPEWSEVKDCPAWDLTVYWYPLRWDKGCLQFQEGPTSPQIGRGLAGCYTQSCINPHLSTECPPVWALCWHWGCPGRAGPTQPFPDGRAGRNQAWLLTPSTTRDWHRVQRETLGDSTDISFFSESPGLGGRKTVVQLNSLTHVWPWANPIHPGDLREEKGRATGASYA